MGEVIIHYRFHSKAGKSMPIIGRSTHYGLDVVVVRQPDGTSAHIPAWMTNPEAKELGVRDQPRLPLICLRNLRAAVGVILGALGNQSDSGNGGTNVTPKAQTGAPASLVSRTPTTNGAVRAGSNRISPTSTTSAARSRKRNTQRKRK
jgi:hypothetical protein